VLFIRYVEKYRSAGQATDKIMANVHCILDTNGYKKTLRISNNYCSSTPWMVTFMRMNFMLYLNCQSVCC